METTAALQVAANIWVPSAVRRAREALDEAVLARERTAMYAEDITEQANQEAIDFEDCYNEKCQQTTALEERVAKLEEASEHDARRIDQLSWDKVELRAANGDKQRKICKLESKVKQLRKMLLQVKGRRMLRR